MAVYKVAQDVEADDKLIGPFSFRQFIYLIVVVMAIGLAWGLSRIFVGLAIIPLPIIIFFGALALPLRKEQPMEIYMAAILSFYLKPRKRLWVPDGITSLVEVTAPKIVEVQRTKDLSQSEAERRLSYLADIADTGGWAIRHAADPGTSMNADMYYDAQQTVDVLDVDSTVGRSFDTMISQADQRHRQEAIQRMQAATHPGATPQPVPAAVTVPPIADPYANLGAKPQPTGVPVQPATIPAPVAAADTATPTPQYNPYPTMRQGAIQPLSEQAAIPPIADPYANLPRTAPAIENTTPSTSETPVSPDIISLANNKGLSIETIQREAERIEKKQKAKDDGEVYISLH